jgi:hypothetical protein
MGELHSRVPDTFGKTFFPSLFQFDIGIFHIYSIFFSNGNNAAFLTQSDVLFIFVPKYCIFFEAVCIPL